VIEKAYSVSGKEIVGSYERVYGCALAEVTRINGVFHMTYDGETKIWWNSQEQVRSDPQDITSERLWVDEDDNVWGTSEIVWRKLTCEEKGKT
jgi:hypothetical protein